MTMREALVGAPHGRDRVGAYIGRGHGPLPHFILLGALLFGVKQLTSDGRTLGLGAEPIVITAAQVEQLRADWRAETRREPTRAELEAAIRRAADEETLLREALRLGLDRSDPVVRSRLVQNLRFAHGAPQADEAALFAEALALGMAHRDVVSRRRLVQAMEERLAAAARITDAQLRDHVAAHGARYAAPRRVSFDQVFLSRDRHRGALDAHAAEIGARLAVLPPDAARALGEPFLLGTRFTAQSQADLARGFGAEFARVALEAPAGAWHGPIRSAYGAHFIRVTAVQAAGEPDVAAVRRQAYYALLEEQERQVVRVSLEALRRAYPLRVEWPALAMAEAS